MFTRTRPTLRLALRSYSTSPPTPPLLLKLRNDLKTAMREKNKERLDVVRSLLAEITNASKTDKPPSTDIHILYIIRKTQSKSTGSVEEFRKAGREDLAEREEGQIKILNEYAGAVETVGREELESIVSKIVEGGEAKMGPVMSAALAQLEGRPFVMSEVAGVVKAAIKK